MDRKIKSKKKQEFRNDEEFHIENESKRRKKREKVKYRHSKYWLDSEE